MHLILLVMAAFLVPLVAMIRATRVYWRSERARRAFARQEQAEAAAGGLTRDAWQGHWDAAAKVPAKSSEPTELMS